MWKKQNLKRCGGKISLQAEVANGGYTKGELRSAQPLCPRDGAAGFTQDDRARLAASPWAGGFQSPGRRQL